MNYYIYTHYCLICGKGTITREPHYREVVICLDCAGRPPYLVIDQIGINGVTAETKLRKRMESDIILDSLLKQAIKEYDSKVWYQKLAVYIKRIINILRT